MKRLALVVVLSVFSFSGLAQAAQAEGPGKSCADAARAAARQEAINIIKQEGIDGRKATVIQANFSAKYVETVFEGVQGTFTDKIEIEFSTPEGDHGYMMLKVEGQQLDHCNIESVNPNSPN